MATKQQVLDLHRQYPAWSANDIARQLACSSGYVRATARRLDLTLPSAKPDSIEALGHAARDAGLSVADLVAVAKARIRAPGVSNAIVAASLITSIALVCASCAGRIVEAIL